jgi:hypothetical protein
MKQSNDQILRFLIDFTPIQLIDEEMTLAQDIEDEWQSYERFHTLFYQEMTFLCQQYPTAPEIVREALEEDDVMNTYENCAYAQIVHGNRSLAMDLVAMIRRKLDLYGFLTPLESLVEMASRLSPSGSNDAPLCLKDSEPLQLLWLLLKEYRANHPAPLKEKTPMEPTTIYDVAAVELYNDEEEQKETPLPLAALDLSGIEIPEIIADSIDRDYCTTIEQFRASVACELRAWYAQGIREPQVQQVLLAAKEGRISAMSYGYTNKEKKKIGCVYGHLCDCAPMVARNLNHLIGDILKTIPPTEVLAFRVHPGDTPETNRWLQILVQILQRYIAALPTETPAVVVES